MEMVFDLARAFAKKGEFETARLLDFEFRQRARAWRIVAGKIGADPDDLLRLIARMDDEAMLKALARKRPGSANDLPALYREASATARSELIGEMGDPSPHRLL